MKGLKSYHWLILRLINDLSNKKYNKKLQNIFVIVSATRRRRDSQIPLCL